MKPTTSWNLAFIVCRSLVIMSRLVVFFGAAGSVPGL